MTTAERSAEDIDPVVEPIHIEMREVASLGSLMTLDNDPMPRPEGGGGWNWLFVTTFVVPALLGAVYLFLVASDRYQSEVRFIVRSTGAASNAMDVGGSSMSSGLSRAGEDAYIVDDYIQSRDVLSRLVDRDGLKDIVSRPEADVFSRFPSLFSSSNRERLFSYYKGMVHTWVDATTGISTVQVTAFRAADAQGLAKALLAYAETVVNRINERANNDRVEFARRILDQAKAAVADAEQRLTAFRTASGTVDPSREYAAALQNIGRLSTEASQREAALNQQIALTPSGPSIASLRERVQSFRDEIARQNRLLVGGEGSLATKMAGYEQLTLEREIASKELANAEANYETSQKEAGQQRLYLQTLVEPNLPDLPDQPKRMLLFMAVVAAAWILYTILKHLRGLAEDHAV